MTYLLLQETWLFFILNRCILKVEFTKAIEIYVVTISHEAADDPRSWKDAGQ
jgi:hypothetical protein